MSRSRSRSRSVPKKKEAPTTGWPEDVASGRRYICVVRHSQALHNVCDDNLWTPDNPLTTEGESMCERAREQWAKTIFEGADLIVVSPMMRALQTAFIMAGKTADTRWLISPMCSEHLSGATCDEGRPKSELLTAIPWISHLAGVHELEEEWWKAPRDEEPLRVTAFLKFLESRGEQKIVVVSHGGFLEYVTGFYMQNAEHHLMSADDCERSKQKMGRSTLNIRDAVSKEYETASFKAIAKAPLTCFHGLGPRRCSLIAKLGPKTVSDLASWKYAKVSAALCELAPLQQEGSRDLSHQEACMNINKILDKEWEGSSLPELLDAPISAFAGITEAHAPTIKSLGLKCIKDLGSWKFYSWARAICVLAEFESVDGSS